MSGIILSEPTPAASLLQPPAAMASYRYWDRFDRAALRHVQSRIAAVIEDSERQGDLFASPAPQPEDAPAAPPVPAPAAPANALGAVLSPSQIKTFLGCSARWWFRYGAGLPDPPNGPLVRGRVVHEMARQYFCERLAGESVTMDDLTDCFEGAWERECQGASFAQDDDLDMLKRQAAALTRKYLEEAAPHIQPAAVETRVAGAIGGVPVQGFIDLIDISGRIIDLKTAARKPAGVDPGYALQLATYRVLSPAASGQVRLDTLVATKTPQLVTLAYEVTAADTAMVGKLYPHVREGIREGLFFPNRAGNLCSRKGCNFWQACEAEYGGCVKGAEE